jgi:hypothetical protein
MGATEEQMRLLSDAGVTHVSYILLLYSLSFLLYLFVNILLHLYAVHAWPEDETSGRKGVPIDPRSASLAIPRSRSGILKNYSDSPDEGSSRMNGDANAKLRMPKHRPSDSQHIKDVEEFELEGLITDGEDDEGVVSPKDAHDHNVNQASV